MKILITGASGYIGNKLAHQLAGRGYKVNALVRSEESKKHLNHPGIEVFRGNILDKKSLAAAMKDCSQVYHTAGLAKLWMKNRNAFYELNVGGTMNVLDVAMENEVKKLVYTSSCGVWSGGTHHALTENDPRINSFDNDYDLSKHLAEKIVREYCGKGLPAVIVNPPRIFGPGLDRYSSGVNRFLQIILRHRVVFLPWHLDVSGNYAFIDDVVNGHILAMERGTGGERYILGGYNLSYRELITAIIKAANSKKVFIRVPPFLLKAWILYGSGEARILQPDRLATSVMIDRITRNKTFDCSKAIGQLGYTITSFEEALKHTIEFLKNNSYGK